MKPLGVLLLAWFLTGACAVAGSILGRALGPGALYAGGLVGGCLGVWASVAIALRLGWLGSADRTGAIAGGLVGFVLAAAIAVMKLSSPVAQVLSASLVGGGVLIGSGAGGRGDEKAGPGKSPGP